MTHLKTGSFKVVQTEEYSGTATYLDMRKTKGIFDSFQPNILILFVTLVRAGKQRITNVEH